MRKAVESMKQSWRIEAPVRNELTCEVDVNAWAEA